jgi:predicted dehydrogenase
MRVHIVGAGLIGRKRAAALDRDDVVVSVADIAEDRAVALAHNLGCPTGSGNSIHEGDVAIIATTHDQLVPMALQYLQFGCHLLIEKPGALSLAEFTNLLGHVPPDRTVGIGYNHRFHPGIQMLKETALSGRLGPIRYVRARYGHGGRLGYETEWRAKTEISGGGELVDQGSHLVDLVHFVAGPFRLTHSEIATLFWNMPVEDNAWLMGELPDGGRVNLHASWTEWKNLFSFEVCFKHGKAEVQGLGGSYGPERYIEYPMDSDMTIPTKSLVEFPGQDTSWQSEWADFKRRVNGAPGLGATDRDALRVLEIIAEVYGHAHN